MHIARKTRENMAMHGFTKRIPNMHFLEAFDTLTNRTVANYVFVYIYIYSIYVMLPT